MSRAPATWLRRAQSLAAVLCVVACILAQSVAACGDPAKFVEFNNGSSVTITVSFEYQGAQAPPSGFSTVQPQAVEKTVLPVGGDGVRFVARTSVGKVLLDPYYSWDQFPKGETPLVIEIKG